MTQSTGADIIFLRASRDIEQVKRHGRRLSTPFFNLMALNIATGPSGVAVIVGRRFGNAVRRNRVKRVFRGLARQVYHDLLSGQALVVFPKREALSQRSEALRQAWVESLCRLHLLRQR